MDYTTMTDEELRLNVAKRKGFDKLRTSRGRWWGEQQATGYARVYIPDWPADIAAAWGLVEEMVDGHADPHISHGWNPNTWDCDTISPRIHSLAPTAPRAICIAWLMWKDAETTQELS